MPSGRHDYRAEIQHRLGTTDAGGNVSPDWETGVYRWVDIQDNSGRELYRAQKNDATIDAVLMLRERYALLTPEHRIIADGRTFEVKAVLGSSDRTARRGQIVHCKEVLS